MMNGLASLLVPSIIVGIMTTKHNHHRLPRLYLKGFSEAGNSSFIWVYRKGRSFSPGGNRHKNNPARETIARAGAMLDAYAYIREDGTLDSDTYENELERLEKPSDPIFRKIREERSMLTSKEKRTLSSYITVTHRRVGKREFENQEKWLELVRNLPTVRTLRSPEFLSSLPTEQRSQLERFLAEYEKEPKREVLLRSMVLGWEEAEFHLSKMTWRFLVAPKGMMFFTGDSPVYTSGLGLKKIAAELTFPISSDITLHASWQPGPEGFILAPDKYVNQLNRRVAKRSEQLFYPTAEPWVTKFLNKKRHDEYLIDVSGALTLLWKNRHLDVPDELLA